MIVEFLCYLFGPFLAQTMSNVLSPGINQNHDDRTRGTAGRALMHTYVTFCAYSGGFYFWKMFLLCYWHSFIARGYLNDVLKF